MTNANDPWGTPEPATSSYNTPKTGDFVAPVPSSNDEVVVTFKAGSGYDAPWIVVHAKDLQDAHDQVSGDNATLLKALMEKVAGAGQYFSALGGGKPAGGTQAPAQRPNTAAPAGASEGPGPAPSCDHGEMVFRSGVAKSTGKAYKVWSCTAPQGQQCKGQFIN